MHENDEHQHAAAEHEIGSRDDCGHVGEQRQLADVHRNIGHRLRATFNGRGEVLEGAAGSIGCLGQQRPVRIGHVRHSIVVRSGGE